MVYFFLLAWGKSLKNIFFTEKKGVLFIPTIVLDFFSVLFNFLKKILINRKSFVYIIKERG